MDIENMKNMIVLKNLPSNMIEEAFVVLKDNIKIHKEEFVSNKNNFNFNKQDKDYVVKEAEMLVKEYADSLNKKEYKFVKEKFELERKYKKIKSLSIGLGFFSILTSIIIILT